MSTQHDPADDNPSTDPSGSSGTEPEAHSEATGDKSDAPNEEFTEGVFAQGQPEPGGDTGQGVFEQGHPNQPGKEGQGVFAQGHPEPEEDGEGVFDQDEPDESGSGSGASQ